MRTLPAEPFLLIAILGLAGCASLGPSRLAGATSVGGAVLRGGDLLLGVESLDPRKGTESRIVRYRRTYEDDTLKVEARTLLFADGVPLSVETTADGHWLAATLDRGGAISTTLWRLREDGRPDPAWQSPEGCQEPSFDPGARFMVMACPPRDRQPAWLLRVGLPDLRMLALVGERPRGAPTVGVEGDLYWVERTDGTSIVMRRAGEGAPYPTHRLSEIIESLHPRDDGVVSAAVRNAQSGLELLDLEPSGAVKPHLLPPEMGVASPQRLLSNTRGDLVAIRCVRGDCAVVESLVEGEARPPMTISGRPVALSLVPSVAAPRSRPEDLATAPQRVLTTHLSSDVSLLGVGLGMSLEVAWAVLEEADLGPWWETAPGSRERPRAIGLGRAAGSWCVEFQADERGVIAAIDMRDCAAHYVSPALRPLLDRRHLVDGALTIVQRYLGPGISMEVGDGGTGPGASRSHPVRRTTLQYDAPERGYQYRSETEVLESSSRRLWDGRVWLRLQEPGKRQAARP